MRLCDAEGIVVIDETTAVGVNLKFGGGANFGGEHVSTFDPVHGVQTQEAHKQVIRDLVARDKNHACVVMWSIANEPDSASEGAYEYFKPLYDFARELDPPEAPLHPRERPGDHAAERLLRQALRRHLPQPLVRLVLRRA